MDASGLPGVGGATTSGSTTSASTTDTGSTTSSTSAGCTAQVCAGASECPAPAGACALATCEQGCCTTTNVAQGTACPGGKCDGQGACLACLVAADCPGEDGPCQQRTCGAGICGLTLAPSGTALAQQTAGDCQKLVCDGAGAESAIPDDSDVPPDDGSSCSAEICVGGAPSHAPKAAGTACAEGGGTACNASGACVSPCADTVKDGGETDVDCGGACPTKCALGKACSVDADCAAGICGAAKTCVQQPSCLATPTCGGGACCQSLGVPGGAFMMGRSAAGTDAFAAGGGSELPEHSVTVSAYALDAFEVTVGRFRAFVAAYTGAAPAANAGAHPSIAGSGWQPAWNGALPASQGQLVANLASCTRSTWTSAPAANESMPINCVSWYEAFAFCTWDGQRLATEAEWEHAAAGGTDNRLYPWGSADPATTKSLANDAYSENSPLTPVGSHPAGNGKWGHGDLAGGVWEWTLDWFDQAWYSGGGASCSSCANLTAGLSRSLRGGSWQNAGADVRAARRYAGDPTARFDSIGFRCAR